MTRIEAIMSQVMELSIEERQELRERIDDSLEEDVDPEFIKELYRRSEEMMSGKVKGIPVEDVFRKIQADLDARRQAQ